MSHTVITSKVLQHIWTKTKSTVVNIHFLLECKGQKSRIVVVVYFSAEVKYF